MKYASIDIETTGLDPHTCDTIEIAVVLEDTSVYRPVAELPAFHCYVLPEEKTYRGDPFALGMHPTIFKRIATKEDGYRYLRPIEVAGAIAEFLSDHDFDYGQVKGKEKLNATGKNFAGFDQRFLRRLPLFDQTIRLNYRVLDPGSQYALPSDEKLPDTKTVCARAGLQYEEDKAHFATYDARLVVAMVRKHWGLPL